MRSDEAGMHYAAEMLRQNVQSTCMQTARHKRSSCNIFPLKLKACRWNDAETEKQTVSSTGVLRPVTLLRLIMRFNLQSSAECMVQLQEPGKAGFVCAYGVCTCKARKRRNLHAVSRGATVGSTRYACMSKDDQGQPSFGLSIAIELRRASKTYTEPGRAI